LIGLGSPGSRLARGLVARRFSSALDRGDISLHYQPIVSLRDGSIAAAEALIRWRTVDGWFPPAAFLPYLEGTRHARRLHAFVLQEATAQARAWERRGHAIQVTINVSPHCVDADLVHDVAAALRTTELPPPLLHLELTELDGGRWLLERAASLEELRGLGVSISIDDFGKGESSLSRLVSLPLDVLKIDQSFIAAMSHDRKSAGIVRSVTDLAHTLEMSAVGEGVETAEQWHSLREWGCDYAQGFLICRPVPADQLMPMLVSSVIPTIDSLAGVPEAIERRAGPDDRRRGSFERRQRDSELWPRRPAARARR
jgi:EAL domain-containing protein (putative c-di-GMP-specific phosphodiesterase class I)